MTDRLTYLVTKLRVQNSNMEASYNNFMQVVQADAKVIYGCLNINDKHEPNPRTSNVIQAGIHFNFVYRCCFYTRLS